MRAADPLAPRGPVTGRAYVAALAGLAALIVAASLARPGAIPGAQFLELVHLAAGIGLAGLLLLGMRAVVAVIAGSLIAALLDGHGVAVSCVMATAGAAEALAGTYLLRNAAAFRNDLGRVRDVLAFLLFGAGIAPMAGATVGAAALAVAGAIPWGEATRVWRGWFFGDAIGILLAGSVLLAWTIRMERPWSRIRSLELGALCALGVPAIVISHGGFLFPDTGASLTFLSFPVVIWASLRFGQKGVSTVVAAVVAVTVWGMVDGNRPFLEARPAAGVVFFYGYSVAVAVTGLLLAAATTEHRRAAEELRRIGQDLDIRVRERTADLQEELVRRMRAQEDLQAALASVKTLSGLLPICASCKKIRDDGGYWMQVERYLTEHTRAQFSHGLCPDCFTALYPEFVERAGDRNGAAEAEKRTQDRSTKA